MSAAPPLSGVRVLELTNRLAGPFCATLLAEFGAEVIKIELPGEGDPYRVIGTDSGAGATFNFLNDNRNKLAITLDVRKPEGVAVFKRILKDCDMLVENFRPGTLEGWGLGENVLRETRKDLILVRISAYGQDGPYRSRPGVARIAFGFAGIAYLTGEPSGPPVLPGTTALGDYLGGLYAGIGALMAYIAKQRDGNGQTVDASLCESVFRMLDELAPVYGKTGYVRERTGAGHPYSVPNNHYLTKDGKWVVIACTAEKMFKRLSVVIDRNDLPDRYPSMKARMAAYDELEKIVRDWVSERTRSEVLQRCLEGDVTAGPINSIADIFEDPHFRARGTLIDFVDPRIGSVTVQDVIPRMSGTPGRINSLGPDLGQHNDLIFKERIGLSEAEINSLKEKKVI